MELKIEADVISTLECKNKCAKRQHDDNNANDDTDSAQRKFFGNQCSEWCCDNSCNNHRKYNS